MSPRIKTPLSVIESFCRKWRINEFSLFGSVLREDFGPESDVDVLIGFEPDVPWSLFDLMDMKEELEGIYGRPVDLLTKRGVEASQNPLRRQAILDNAELIYAA